MQFPMPHAVDAAADRCDVLIMGGGLAGLTLALQLRQRFPDLDIRVIERRTHPVPEAAHKVGESSVELGAHYFAEVLGLREHLETQQIRKFGFRFFFSEGERALDQVTEIGVRRALPVPSWQIDRGIFENFLATEVQRRGVPFADGARVTRLALHGDSPPRPPGHDGAAPAAARPHELHWEHQGRAHSTHARWVVDACGRAGLIKRQLGLARPNEHGCHAVWFRVAHRLQLDDWPGNAAWRSECVPPERWRSTNHLVGAGYWVWLIPLASGSHSVGIVADPRLHPLETMDTFDKAMDWLQRWQPAVFDALDGQRHTLQDFAFLRRFSYDCRQVFSGQRWALTGEAGLFLDPFYSPGSDYIAIGNTYITELIARDLAGLPIEGHAQLYDQLYHSFYEGTLAMYQDQYPLFGEPEVLPVKVIWDYSYYWGILAQLYLQGRIADLRLLSALRPELQRCQRLNLALQQLLRDWGRHNQRRNPACMLDQSALPWFAALNASLLDRLDDTALRQRLRDNAHMLAELAQEVLERAEAESTAPLPEATRQAVRALVAEVLPADARGPQRLFPLPVPVEAVAQAVA